MKRHPFRLMRPMRLMILSLCAAWPAHAVTTATLDFGALGYSGAAAAAAGGQNIDLSSLGGDFVGVTLNISTTAVNTPNTSGNITHLGTGGISPSITPTDPTLTASKTFNFTLTGGEAIGMEFQSDNSLFEFSTTQVNELMQFSSGGGSWTAATTQTNGANTTITGGAGSALWSAPDDGINPGADGGATKTATFTGVTTSWSVLYEHDRDTGANQPFILELTVREVVPEPGRTAFMLLGLSALVLRRTRRQR